MNEIKNARLIKTEAGRAIELPADFVLPTGFDVPGTEFALASEGDKLVLRAQANLANSGPETFRDMLDQMETIDIEWPDVDEGLLPPDDVKL